jgi:membrane-associated phospholipid phosphatase
MQGADNCPRRSVKLAHTNDTFKGCILDVSAATGSLKGRATARLDPTDKLIILFWTFLACISLVFHSIIPSWWMILLANLAGMALVWALVYGSQSGSRVWRCVHDWAAFLLVLFTYKELYFMIKPIHSGKDYDALLIAIDRYLFQVNPTEWLARFSNPLLTEILQAAYSVFYLFFIVVGIELYRRHDKSGFYNFRFTVVYGFFLSYLGYFLLPAIGPRFTLHDFSGINTDLPGILFTPALRWFINIFESIHAGMSNTVAIANAQRDVFPSGHAMLTLVVMVMAHRAGLKTRACVLVMGMLLIIATVYLRYHYVIDVIAGIPLALLCLKTSRKIYGHLERRKS